MSAAYNSRSLTYPLSNLKDLLLFDSVEETAKECSHFGLTISGEVVHFRKGEIKDCKVSYFLDKF